MRRLRGDTRPRQKGYVRVDPRFLKLAKELSEREDGNDILQSCNLDRKRLVVFLFRGLCEPPQGRGVIADAIGIELKRIAELEDEVFDTLGNKMKKAGKGKPRKKTIYYKRKIKEKLNNLISKVGEMSQDELEKFKPEVDRLNEDFKNIKNQRLNEELLICTEMENVGGALKALAEGAYINARNHLGRTALSIACRNNNRRIVGLLMSRGADPGIADEDGIDAFKYAIENADREILEFIYAKTERDISDEHRDKSLLYATSMGYTFLVKKLVERYDVNTQDIDGDTALILATKNGDVEAIKILMDAGAKIDMLNNDGHTALDYAEKYKHWKVIKLISRRKQTKKYRYGQLTDDELVEEAKETADGRSELIKKDSTMWRELKRRERDLLSEAYGPPKYLTPQKK